MGESRTKFNIIVHTRRCRGRCRSQIGHSIVGERCWSRHGCCAAVTSCWCGRGSAITMSRARSGCRCWCRRAHWRGLMQRLVCKHSNKTILLAPQSPESQLVRTGEAPPLLPQPPVSHTPELPWVLPEPDADVYGFGVLPLLAFQAGVRPPS